MQIYLNLVHSWDDQPKIATAHSVRLKRNKPTKFCLLPYYIAFATLVPKKKQIINRFALKFDESIIPVDSAVAKDLAIATVSPRFDSPTVQIGHSVAYG